MGPGRLAAAYLGLWCSIAAAGAQSNRPAVEPLLQRVAAYVADFDRQFSNVVAEEHYEQRYTHRIVNTASTQTRTLVADFLMARAPSQETLVPFRDVLTVDGEPVRDRQDRLTKLFLQPTDTAIAQAQAIMEDSARYNLGPRRTINVPVLALLVVREGNQHRFAFSSLSRDASLGDDVWSMRFRERQRPTLIKSNRGADAPCSGRLWIDAATGRVLRTEITVAGTGVSATTVTDYRYDPTFSVAVPVAMREIYTYARRFESLNGAASYSNFRKFDVSTSERIKNDGD